LSPTPPVECLSRIGPARCASRQHRPGQRDALVQRHALEEHGHGESRGLALGDRAGCQALNEGLDLGGGKRDPVTLLTDDFLGEH
jgi:hypothetical protein